ncbi:HesA/MoeB/ThiF family protein [Rhodovulum sp. DZ06]|uniref:HesA/MoeB/ThiF family protein n=1 Tax=Rhodovulum sp. DZ06 TaxID=3425126 RepID=UPI003D333279
MSFSDAELERYARHIVLREIGGPGQKRLKAANVLVVGAGGLGAPALMYLAAAGVGRIAIADDDAVSLSNLQRQVIHDTAAIGRPKVDSAAEALARINPEVEVERIEARVTEDNAAALLDGRTLALDGTDSFATRRLVNRACAAARVPLVSAALGQWEGQLSVFAPWEGGPCWECVFPEDPAPGLVPNCAEAGVLGALAGAMGALQAAEAVKRITGAGEGLVGRLALFDLLGAEYRTIRVKKRDGCACCAAAGL